MKFTVKQIAEILHGTVEGDDSSVIDHPAKIEEAGSGALAFLANPKYEHHLYDTRATAVIVKSDFTLKRPVNTSLIRVEDPYSAFSVLLEEYYKRIRSPKQGKEDPIFVGEDVKLGENIYLGAFSYVGNRSSVGKGSQIHPQVYIGEHVVIGEETVIYPGCKLYPGTVVGSRCVVHAGAVIGSDGFGYAPQKDGSYKAVPQIGNVIIEDDVEIGANTVIDCATMGSTIIRRGVKLDNLIQIAHNVEIGKNTAIAAQTGISGSSKIGENCIIAGQVGIVGHVTVADRTTIAAQSGIGKSLEEAGKVYMGSPAFEKGSYMRSYALFRNLTDLQKQIEQLREKIVNLPSS